MPKNLPRHWLCLCAKDKVTCLLLRIAMVISPASNDTTSCLCLLFICPAWPHTSENNACKCKTSSCRQCQDSITKVENPYLVTFLIMKPISEWYTLISSMSHAMATKVQVILRRYVVLTWMHDNRELV